MNIESRVKKNKLEVKIDGRIDMDSSPELEKYLDERLDEGIRSVELDFRNVEYISSAGLRVLIKLIRHFDDNKEAITITHLNDTVRSVFELTGFDDKFIIKSY